MHTQQKSKQKQFFKFVHLVVVCLLLFSPSETSPQVFLLLVELTTFIERSPHCSRRAAETETESSLAEMCPMMMPMCPMIITDGDDD
jgi:hypothetical protein